MNKLKIGVSACLTGDNVRYDGGSKLNRWMMDRFGEYVTFTKFCPEMMMGLGVPRETVQLRRNSDTGKISLVGSKSGTDHTNKAIETVGQLISNLPSDLDGFVLMSNSPSCGQRFVKVYESKNGIPHKDGVGFLAKSLSERFPNVPAIESYRLNEERQREAFLCHLFAYRELSTMSLNPSEIQRFHRDNKYLYLSFNPKISRDMGRLVAGINKSNMAEELNKYASLLKDVFSRPRRQSHGEDALLHMNGYLKRELSREERHFLIDSVEKYRKGLVHFATPLNLIRLANLRISDRYIAEQKIFEPYPEGLSAQA